MGALIGAVLIAISLWQPSFFSGVRGAAQDAVAPATETVASARTESKGLFETVRGYLDAGAQNAELRRDCLLYTSPSPRDLSTSRMPSSA